MTDGLREPTICECGDHAFAAATRGYVVLVSPEDASVLNRKWFCAPRKTGPKFMHTPRSRKTQILAREILSAPDGKLVDHINRNTTDNRRENLRLCDHAQNTWNSYRRKSDGLPKGVHRQQKWFIARINCRGERIFLGNFTNANDAAAAYSAAAEKFHGDFARTGP